QDRQARAAAATARAGPPGAKPHGTHGGVRRAEGARPRRRRSRDAHAPRAATRRAARTRARLEARQPEGRRMKTTDWLARGVHAVAAVGTAGELRAPAEPVMRPMR